MDTDSIHQFTGDEILDSVHTAFEVKDGLLGNL